MKKEQWLEILKDGSITTPNARYALYAFYFLDGRQGSCTTAAAKFGQGYNFYNATIMNFGKAVTNKLDDFQIVDKNGEINYWSVPMGKGWNGKGGHFVWQLRPELVEAMQENLIEYALAEFKKSFNTQTTYSSKTHWEEEEYKWIAVKTFQDYWNPDASDFAAMLEKSLSKVGNLMDSGRFFPKGMLLDFCKYDAEIVRGMFRNLYDESIDLGSRVSDFIAKGKELTKAIAPGMSSYQSTNSVSTLLWLRFPEKYFIYKYSEDIAICNKLGLANPPKANGSAASMLRGFEIYDLLCRYIHRDADLRAMLQEHLKSDESKYHRDEALHTLTIDFGFWTSNFFEGFMKPQNVIEGSKDKPKIWIFAPGEDAETIATPRAWADFKSLPELQDMEFIKNQNGSLFKLTEEEYSFLIELIGSQNKRKEDNSLFAYRKKDFLNEVFMSEGEYDRLSKLVKYKKNVILQGAPGVGKTFAAKRLAYSIMGEVDESRVEMVQFHQNYSYEDFIMGYKPTEDGGFALRTGIFYDFCQKARSDKGRPYFFIIDEINRGNLSKIFGELLMLIENDHRKDAVRLAYRDEKFSVPENVHIIGMMNTADRSLAMIDYALRRRFSFYTMFPGFDTPGFKKLMTTYPDTRTAGVVEGVKALNETIRKDDSLGEGFCIGHSYFCGKENVGVDLYDVVNFDIAPMLEEYWFDNPTKAKEETSKLQKLLI